jgi:hypothetical protein
MRIIYKNIKSLEILNMIDETDRIPLGNARDLTG